MNEGLNEDWKRAVANWDLKEILELCMEESCDNKAAREAQDLLKSNDQHTPFSLAISTVTSMRRIQFLVQECGLVPNSSTLEYATSCHYWAAVKYFHNELGIRYTDRFYCRSYLRYLETFASQERAVHLVLQYLPWFTQLCDDHSDHQLVTNIACFRYKRAQNASVALLSLKRKRPDLASKDVLRLIAQIIMDKRSVAKEEWGLPWFWQQHQIVSKGTKEFVVTFVVLCFIWSIIMGLFILINHK
jgi:hypothetical protein